VRLVAAVAALRLGRLVSEVLTSSDACVGKGAMLGFAAAASLSDCFGLLLVGVERLEPLPSSGGGVRFLPPLFRLLLERRSWTCIWKASLVGETTAPEDDESFFFMSTPTQASVSSVRNSSAEKWIEGIRGEVWTRRGAGRIFGLPVTGASSADLV
jgi:hypothetical protein